MQHSRKHSLAVEQFWAQTTLQIDSSALLLDGLFCAVLICSRLILVLQLSQGDRETELSSMERKSVLPEPAGNCFCGEKSQPLVCDWSVLIQMRTPNPDNLIGLKGTVLVGQNKTTLMDQCSCDWMGKASVLSVKIGFQELFFKGWLIWQKQSARSQFSAEAGCPTLASP